MFLFQIVSCHFNGDGISQAIGVIFTTSPQAIVLFVELIVVIIQIAHPNRTVSDSSISALSLPSASGNKMSESDFAANLQRIRYREGKIDGYTSRLHYTSDWINNGVRGGFMEDVTAANSPYTQKLSLSYMSSHPELYKHLSNSPENVTKMAEYEKALSGQEIHWLPKDKLPVNGLPWIKSGDIIVLTTNIPGLDTAHMGIAIYVKDTLCLLHASSSRGKVLVDKLALSRLLDRNKKWTGIRVIRMKR